MYNILFVCKFNRLRSKLAESLMRNYIKNKEVDIKSAGLMLDPIRPFVSKEVIDVLKQRGLKVADEKSILINKQMIEWANKIIVVSDNLSLSMFPPEKVEIWGVKDANEGDTYGLFLILSEIEKYVQQLTNRLNRK
ncbi:MAG: hypothetical protein AABX11_01970 [Nanoarchaeota archaeon]